MNFVPFPLQYNGTRRGMDREVTHDFIDIDLKKSEPMPS